MTIVLAFSSLAGVAVGARAETYSDAQMELAGRIGAAVALSRICSGTVPTTAVIRTLEANGLTESDVLDDTPVRARMRQEASAVMLTHKTEQDNGRPQVEIVKSACDSFRASFGPDGLLAPDIAGASSCSDC